MSKKGKAPVVEEVPVMEPDVVDELHVESGCFIFPDGSKYEGEWKMIDGVQMKDGNGTFTCGPDRYSGGWVHDRMDGEGEYIFSSGALYRGSFSQNQFHGEGEYIFPDGAKYRYFVIKRLDVRNRCVSGGWARGKMHGTGVYTDPDGVEWRGNFFNGMFDSGRSYLSLRPSKTLA